MGWWVQVVWTFSWNLMDGCVESWDRMRISIWGCQPTGAVEAESMKKWKSKLTSRKLANELPVKMSSSSNQLGIDCAWRKSASGATCTLNWMVNDWISIGGETVAVESNWQIDMSFPSRDPSGSPRALEIILRFRREVSCPSRIGSWRYDRLFFF